LFSKLKPAQIFAVYSYFCKMARNST